MPTPLRLLVFLAALATPAIGATQPATGVAAPGYADLTDLVLAAPVIGDAVVRSTTRLKSKDVANVPAGLVRLYVEAEVRQLIRGADGLPPRVGYLLDVRPDLRGKLPSLKKARVLLFARPTPVPGQLQLVSPDAQLRWLPDVDAQVRAIVREALSADAAPRVTGVGNAFHVAGALPGEGETQVFLQTADNRPISLIVLRRPGERPRWAVALSEIVDEAAAPPPRDTLLWYRLACSLPAALPALSTAELAPADTVKAQEDYRYVLAQLGACGRSGTSG